MKKTSIIFFVFSVQMALAQIGIGTNHPTAQLHVAGDMLISKSIKTAVLQTVQPQDEDFKLIARTTTGETVGELKVLDVNALNVAPVNVVNYHFTNIHLDNVQDVNLQYDTSKYIIGIANFRQTGDAVKKIPVNETFSIGNFVVRTFEEGGTWHLEIRNQSLDLDASKSVEYFVSLIVYNKSYFRHLAPIATNLNGKNKGTASTTPVIL